MTGVLNAMVASGNKSRHSVTMANVGNTADLYGYDTNQVPSGAILPVLFAGGAGSVLATTSRAGHLDFSFVVNGIKAQSFIQSVMVETTNGTWSTYRQQNVSSFQAGPVVTTWTWGSGSAPAWTSASPSPRLVIIAY